MRVPTTFRARRGLRSIVFAGLLSAYYDDANARLLTPLDSTTLEGIAGPGTMGPGDSPEAGPCGSIVTGPAA